MTYKEVVRILGAEGALLSEKRLEVGAVQPGMSGNFVQRQYVWKNPDGSSMTLSFLGNMLVGKKQRGLR